MNKRATLLAGLALFLAGCVGSSVPIQRDLAAEMGVETAAYKNMTVAMFYSEQTEDSLQGGAKADKVSIVQRRNGIFMPENWFGEMRSRLSEHFKKVIRVGDMIGAKNAHADLIAVVDNYFSVQIGFHTVVKLNYGVIFLTPDGQQIAAVRSRPLEVSQIVWEATSANAVAQEALTSFIKALRESDKLEVYAQARSGAPGAASPNRASTAPPAPAYHSDVDTPRYHNPENADNYALVVGVERYENLPQADFAERDAKTMREHLLALGYPERNIVLLTGTRAGKAGMEKNLESWLPRNVKTNSKVFFYFSGHGAPDVKNGLAYLMPWDGDAKYVETTGYPVKKLYEKLNALRAREVIVAMDSCFSGAGGRSVLAKGLRPLVNKIDVGANSMGKVVVLSASGSDEVTGTAEDQGHGLFTYYLLKAINERQGKARVRDLYESLSPKVQDRAHRDNREQTPQLLPGGAESSANPSLGG